MKKKSLIMLLIGFLMVGVVGCGGKNSDTEQKSSNQSESAQTEGSSNNNDSSNKEDNKETLDLTTIEGINADQFVTTKKNDEYKYDVYENHIEIVEYLGNEKRVEIPSEIDGLKVCRIVGFCNTANVNKKECKLEEVVIPEGVVCIGDNDSYEDIFDVCVYDISIPCSVKEITVGSFFGTEWYTNLSEEYCMVGDGILIKCNLKDNNVTHLKYPEGVKMICARDWTCVGFKGMSTVLGKGENTNTVTEITIPEGCKKIDVGTFSEGTVQFATDFSYIVGGNRIEVVNIPNSLERVSYRAFCGTKWLDNKKEDYVIVGDGILIDCNLSDKTDIYNIPEGVKYIACHIGNQNYDKKSKMILPKSIEGFGRYSFEICSLSNSFKRDLDIDKYAFSYSPHIMEEYIVSSNLKNIPPGIFCGIDVKFIKISEGVETIGSGAFRGCHSTENVEIPNTCKYIKNDAFNTCRMLKKISIPEGVKYIGDRAFYNISEELEYIEIPESVTYIGENAFTRFIWKTDEDGFVSQILSNIPEIRGVKGSYAETYAKENGINFVEIESN